MKIDFSCALHPGTKALQISKCAAHHQLCGPCSTAANESGHCPSCQGVLKQLMPEPICQYQIGKFKLATIFNFRHRLPCELLDEMIKFCGLEYFPRVAFFCRPKNVNLLVANSALNAFATNQLKLKADFYFKRTLMTLLTKIGPRIRDNITRSKISEQELENIATKMLRNKGKYISAYELLGIEMAEIRANKERLKSRLWDIGMIKWRIEKEMKELNIIDKN